MSPGQPESVVARRSADLAPPWHTTALIAVILAVAATGTLLTAQGAVLSPASPTSSLVAVAYLPIIAVQWSLALYVCRIGRSRNALPSLLGRRWSTPGRFVSDVALAGSGWLLLEASEVTWSALVGRPGVAASVIALLPLTGLDRLAWVLVSVSVGICEELVYRGYLQVQLAAFTRRANLGVVLQATLFGIAHAEQGAGAVVRFALYGLAFGALARWRRSLLPGILCHVWTDVASGCLRG